KTLELANDFGETRMNSGLSARKQNLAWIPFRELRVELFEKSIRHLPFIRELQRFVVLPDRTRDATTVTNVVEIQNDDGQDRHPMRALLKFNFCAVDQMAQFRNLQSRAADSGTADSRRTGFPMAQRRIRACIATHRV